MSDRTPSHAANLVLASASPRRAELLRQIGISPVIEPAAVDETIHSGDHPLDSVTRLANDKAAAIAGRYQGQQLLVLGADTVVCVGDMVLGKPADAGEAISMLHRLSDTTHEVHTGVSIVDVALGRAVTGTATTRVTMRALDSAEIAAYVATDEPTDAAGGYAIQGRAATFVARIDGEYSNVVGLPLHLTASLLRSVGFEVSDFWLP